MTWLRAGVGRTSLRTGGARVNGWGSCLGPAAVESLPSDAASPPSDPDAAKRAPRAPGRLERPPPSVDPDRDDPGDAPRLAYQSPHRYLVTRGPAPHRRSTTGCGRDPDPIEALTLADQRILAMEFTDGDSWELAMSVASLTGLLSWLESAPPGARYR